MIGGVAGGLAGKAIAESIDPTTEEAYWREEYPKREYYDKTVDYEKVGPAYRYGWESRAEHYDRNWDEVEPELRRGWTSRRGESNLEWDRRADRRVMLGSELTVANRWPQNEIGNLDRLTAARRGNPGCPSKNNRVG